VAADESNGVVGWIHGARQELIESESRCEILGLIVHQEHRRRGIARALVAAVEQWSLERGLHLVSVRSAVSRAEAHPFYESLHYQRVKTQHVYRKKLP
jgi:GNAT superfamily N-acetyltransferase